MHTIVVLTSCACLFVGMISLNLAMEKSYKEIFNPKLKLSQHNALRILGWRSLLLALFGTVTVWGIGIGLTA